eukprot:TRINITY_DN55445_c0_g1_i1.p2 TRINITY_DN55445_c0_g1~~TRINITY_DN55445_c0_g1_i1.p2  ORF type:complete len:267 (+),score=95.27 TRINITY_DN55445_c0_g1_i1:87-803(+)
MGELTLIGFPAFRAFRNVWMLEELGVPYKLNPINPQFGATHTRSFRKEVNPLGKIPCLRDGDFLLRESAAINTYLGDKFGKLVPPPRTQQRALYDQWCMYCMSELDAQGLWIHRKHQELGKAFGEAPDAVRAAKRYFQNSLSTVSEELRGKGHDYVLGADFSAADVLLTHCLMWANQIGWELEPAPDAPQLEWLQCYWERCTGRPAYKRTKQIAGEALREMARQSAARKKAAAEGAKL